MEIMNFIDCEDVKIDKFSYKEKLNEVIGTNIHWLNKHGDDGHGYPEYGLRYFTIQPKGYIQIHYLF